MHHEQLKELVEAVNDVMLWADDAVSNLVWIADEFMLEYIREKQDSQENKLIKIQDKLEEGTGKIRENKEKVKSAHFRLDRHDKRYYLTIGASLTMLGVLLKLIL